MLLTKEAYRQKMKELEQLNEKLKEVRKEKALQISQSDGDDRHDNFGFEQAADMLEKAFNKIPDNTNLILHSDQGWQYQMKQYQHLLKENGIRQSMSRKGNCLDNSLSENFFGLLKSELFYMKEYKTIEELEKDIIEYIDYYNNKRIKGKLKGMSPVQYRVHFQAA